LVFDKSALQALNIDEAVWLDLYFYCNVIPLLFVETLADLAKEMPPDRSPEALVGMLANKTPPHAVPNVFHRRIVMSELSGYEVPMTYRPLIEEGEIKRAPDGTYGLHIEGIPEQEALQRWKEGRFTELERDSASGWRAELRSHDASRIGATLSYLLPVEKISGLDELKAFVDGLCAKPDPNVLLLAMEVLGIPDDIKGIALRRWATAKEPSLPLLAPYTTHVLKVDLLYYLGVSRGFISGDRASNRADMAYLYYLPFTQVFASDDRLHRMTVPLFLTSDQSYLPLDELKAALGEIDGHQDRLPEGIKARGVLALGSFPPSTLENAVTKLWDTHMRPDWRKLADASERRLLDSGSLPDQSAVAEVNAKLEQARSIGAEEASGAVENPDYVVIRRWIPATRGKWRTLPQENKEDS
jgi:hypothetical protein